MAPVKKPQQQLQRTYLREWRQHNNLSQEAAASRLNVSRTLLSKIERANSPYNQKFLENAAIAYGCEPADLIIRNPLIPDAVWSLQEQLKMATPEEQKQIADIAAFVLSKRTGT